MLFWGLSIVRQAIADFITKRDGGVPAKAEDVYLCTGASGGIKIVMNLLLNGEGQKPAGFMIPIPQYPLYSATISEYSAAQVFVWLITTFFWSEKMNIWLI